MDLRTGDVTDVFATTEVDSSEFAAPESSEELRRAEILARSTLATSLDTSKVFTIPAAVRASAQRALEWRQLYNKQPLIAAAVPRPSQFLTPPDDVRSAALIAVGDPSFTETDRARVLQLVRSEQVPADLADRMHLFFSRHDEASTPRSLWNSWGGDAGKSWAARVMSTRERGTDDLTEVLATADTIDYDTLKLLPRAFSVLTSPHELSCAGDGRCTCGGSRDSGTYPSDRALDFAAIGGEAGRSWANETVAREELAALRAAGYNPDAGVLPEDTEVDPNVFDATKPHQFAPITTFPSACLYCLKGERDGIHDDEAVDYSIADIDPGSSHYFVQSMKDEGTCEICDKPVDDTLHKQAALASYYANKAEWDKAYAETQKSWDGQDQGLSAAASIFGIDWVEDDDLPPEELDLFEQSALVDEDMEGLAWQRRDDLYDDLTYYAAYSGDDSLLVDQIYVGDGPLIYRYDQMARHWVETSLASDEQIFEIDDESAHAVMRALSLFPNRPVDLRELNPGEALLMQQCIPGLEQERLSDFAVISSAAVFAPDGYTPQERSQNAKKQVRDAGGRFAKGGSRVMTPSGAGTVRRIDPIAQRVEVTGDNGENIGWVDAKRVNVMPSKLPPNKLQRMIKQIPGKPRAVGGVPKAQMKHLLQPMDANGLHKVMDDYAAMIREDRRKGRQIHRWERQVTHPKRKKPHGVGVPAPIAADPNGGRPVTAAGTPITSPDTSDVAPMYLAVVDSADHASVLDLLAMTPASSDGEETVVWRRTEKGWEQDPDMLREMRSTAPPPIVKLSPEDYPDVLAQVDSFYKSPQGKQSEQDVKDESPAPVAAAAYGPYGELLATMLGDDPAMLAAGIPGIADTPSDVADTERLKRYWTIGEGGLKIRWNTPGDMTRCMRYLRKYMPRKDMHAGYCAKLHHEMTGTWPGDKRNIGVRGSGLFQTKILKSEDVIAYSAMVAAAQVSLDGNPIPVKAEEVPTEISGAPFRIPILAPVGVKSGDGRSFSPLALSTRDLPLPLMWQVQTQEGHDASVIVGRIDSIERLDDGSLGEAYGVFDVGPYGKEAERLVRHKFLRGVSVDLDEFEAEARPAMPERDEDADEMGVVKIRPDEMTITHGRVMGATLVAKPAFQEVSIELNEPTEEVVDMADGTYIGTPGSDAETEAMVASALVAAGIPLNPPVEWFDDPKLTQRTPLTIEDDGRVFGHIATWDVEHIGLPFSTTPPKSRSNYAYFHTGILRTAQGVDVPVGQITLAGGHADLNADAAMAVKHYDDTASAMCDVHAGEDAFGIWVAGALRPSVSGEQIRAMRAAAPSGDWRPINGRLEMVAVCQVNVPGFPITRARVASGHVFALVAAGTSTLNRIRAEKQDPMLEKLLARIDALEAPQRDALERAREAAVERIDTVRRERAERARARFATLQSAPAVFKDYSADKRDEMAKNGEALADGSYPIANVADLKRAVMAYGRAKPADRAKVRRHIRKRAKDLSKTDLIPESWGSAAAVSEDVADALTMSMLAVTAAVTGHYPNGEPWDPTNHPRDDRGRFRDVIAKLRNDLEGETGTADVVAKLDVAQQAEEQGDVDAAKRAAQDVLTLVDKIGQKTIDPEAVKTLREGYTNLAEAVANLPLAQGDLNKKFRFTDLPQDLQGLIRDLMSRAEKRLEPDAYDKATSDLQSFITGVDVMSQPDISSALSRVLRFLI